MVQFPYTLYTIIPVIYILFIIKAESGVTKNLYRAFVIITPLYTGTSLVAPLTPFTNHTFKKSNKIIINIY